MKEYHFDDFENWLQPFQIITGKFCQNLHNHQGWICLDFVYAVGLYSNLPSFEKFEVCHPKGPLPHGEHQADLLQSLCQTL